MEPRVRAGLRPLVTRAFSSRTDRAARVHQGCLVDRGDMGLDVRREDCRRALDTAGRRDDVCRLPNGHWLAARRVRVPPDRRARRRPPLHRPTQRAAADRIPADASRRKVGDVRKPGARLSESHRVPGAPGRIARGVHQRRERAEEDVVGVRAKVVLGSCHFRLNTGGASGIAAPSWRGSDPAKCTPAPSVMTAWP